MKAVDRAVAELAIAQHRVFSRRQALSAGASRHVCDRRVGSGAWVPARYPGAYSLASSIATWHQRLMAAVLASRDGTVASHQSAAVLHGIREGQPIELTAPRGGRRVPGAHVHQGVELGRRVVLDGIPSTRVERTLVDLGTVVGDAAVESALEAALRLGLTTAERVRGELARLGAPGRRGVAPLRRVLDRRSDGRPTGSDLEVLMIQQRRDAGLPDPVRQYEARLGGEHDFIDLAYAERRLAIELDWRESHSDPDAFIQDRARQNLLVLAGWTMLRFTWADVTGGSAAAVVAQGLAA